MIDWKDCGHCDSPAEHQMHTRITELESKLDGANKRIDQLNEHHTHDLTELQSRLGTLESELESWQEMCRHAERNDHVHMDERDAALLRLGAIREALSRAGYDAKFDERELTAQGIDLRQIPELRVINEIWKMLWHDAETVVERVCARCGVGEIVVVEGQLRCTMCGLDYESRAVETPHE